MSATRHCRFLTPRTEKNTKKDPHYVVHPTLTHVSFCFFWIVTDLYSLAPNFLSCRHIRKKEQKKLKNLWSASFGSIIVILCYALCHFICVPLVCFETFLRRHVPPIHCNAHSPIECAATDSMECSSTLFGYLIALGIGSTQSIPTAILDPSMNHTFTPETGSQPFGLISCNYTQRSALRFDKRRTSYHIIYVPCLAPKAKRSIGDT